jgi:cytochrome c550
MSKRGIILFAVFAIAFGLAVPYWAISKEGSKDASPEAVAAADQEAKDLFQANCGSCHTLARAGTDGIVGPNLDDLLGTGTPEANEQRVANAIENGVAGRMPAGILQGEDAELVADFVARNAGQ